MGLTKEAAMRGWDTTLAESLHIGSMLARYMRTTEDAKEGAKGIRQEAEA